MRDAAGLVAPLSWLAVWNRQLIARKNGREEAEDDDNDEDAYDPLARAGVLYATICRNGPSMHDADAASSGTSQEDARSQRDLLARRIGLAQGLVDFTR